MHSETLDSAIASFRTLVSSPHSSAWRSLPQPQSSISVTKGKGKELNSQRPEVSVHRRKGAPAQPDILRAQTDFTLSEPLALDDWRAVLQTPELKSACPSPLSASGVNSPRPPPACSQGTNTSNRRTTLSS